MTIEFQTRSEETGLDYFGTFEEAYEAAKKDPTIWKISFSVGEERIRLRRGEDDRFYVAPMSEEMEV